MNILFFDTETNGVPRDYQGTMKDLDNWPRIIQLAWQVASSDGVVACSHKYLIKPDGWTVPEEKFWIDHGYSTGQCEADGYELPKILDLFISYVEECELMVAHNMNFDYPILGAEMIRYDRKSSRKLQRFCTMELSVELCKLPGKYGKYKWPKLEELHQFLFKNKFEGAHDAGSDVAACRTCFFEMVKRGVIKIPSLAPAVR